MRRKEEKVKPKSNVAVNIKMNEVVVGKDKNALESQLSLKRFIGSENLQRKYSKMGKERYDPQ